MWREHVYKQSIMWWECAYKQAIMWREHVHNKVWRYRRERKLKKEIQYNSQSKRTKGQTTIYKTLHRKQKIYQHEPN